MAILFREAGTKHSGSRLGCLSLWVRREKVPWSEKLGPVVECDFSSHLLIVAMQVMTVVRDRGSLAPLTDRNLSASSGAEAAAVAAKKSVDSGPSRTPSSLAFCGLRNPNATNNLVQNKTQQRRGLLFCVWMDAFISPNRSLSSPSRRKPLAQGLDGGAYDISLSAGSIPSRASKSTDTHHANFSVNGTRVLRIKTVPLSYTLVVKKRLPVEGGVGK